MIQPSVQQGINHVNSISTHSTKAQLINNRNNKLMKSNIQTFSIQDCLVLTIACLISPSVFSEVTLDGSVGTAGALSGPNYQITEDVGQRAGSNLFHSFGQFNLNNTESATFSGSAGIQNVIGRVTGGQASSIDGTLRVTIPDANLYLLNPAGILFGQNAKLDVPGSFHASTADLLKFQDGVQFESGTATPNPILTTALPEAFGFLGENPAGISVTGGNNTTLEVPNGEMISLVGGDITIKDSSLYAPGGQINLASVGSAGDVVVTELGLDTASFERMGNISISQDPLVPSVTIAPEMPAIANVDVSADTAGKVFIRGGQMVMENTNIWSDTTHGDGKGIDIGLTGDLDINGIAETPEIDSAPQSGITSYSLGNGNAGNINLDVNVLKLTHGTRVDSTASSSGNGGDLNINANSVDMQTNSLISSATLDQGNAGDLVINTDALKVYDDSVISSRVFATGDGNAGNLIVNASSMDIYNNSAILSTTEGNGDTGNLTINANSLKVNDGFIINDTNNRGDAGDLTIKTGSLEFFGGVIGTLSNSPIETLSNVTASGTNGNIKIEANSILLVGDSQNSAAQITGSVLGNNDTGNLTVISEKLEIKDWASINKTISGSGDSGNLLVDAKEIVISNNAGGINGITANLGPNATGNSGDLTVRSQNLVMQNGAQIRANNAGSGDGGNLTVKATDSIVVEGASETTTTTLDSSISNRALSTGKVGNSTVVTKTLEVLNGANISADTNGSANAGNLSIFAENLMMQDKGIISAATGGTGSGGILKLNVDQIDMNKSFIATLTLGQGNAGNTIIDAGEIAMRNNSLISASTSDVGSGGVLTINVDDLHLNDSILSTASTFVGFDSDNELDLARSGDMAITSNGSIRLENNSSIVTFTNKANAGKIEINGEGSLQLHDNSSILTSVSFGEGKGGDISINTPTVAINDISFITADAAVEGGNGNINIPGFLFKSPASVIKASSRLDIKPDTIISGSIAELPDIYMDATTQLSERCASRSGVNLSSFVVKGSGGLPVAPGDLAPANLIDYPSVKEHLPPEISSESRKVFGSLDSQQGSTHAGLDNRYQLLPSASGCIE
ncbi:MAG: filamentous hemagglutinin N-terminal domain-containing protein [Methylococcaceae bacterium]